MDDRPICEECGNDVAAEGQRICLDCLEGLYPETDPPPE